MGSRSIQSSNYRNPCLTMHQPWASLLVYGIKRIEGRSWPAPIRGTTIFNHEFYQNPFAGYFVSCFCYFHIFIWILSLVEFVRSRAPSWSSFFKFCFNWVMFVSLFLSSRLKLYCWCSIVCVFWVLGFEFNCLNSFNLAVFCAIGLCVLVLVVESK